MKSRTWGIVFLAALVVVAIYYFFDPSASAGFPRCRFYVLTGYQCPGCGSQRMVHSLLHFDFVSAFRYNAYLLTLFPLLLLSVVWEGWQQWLPPSWRGGAYYAACGLLVASTLLWWLLRNVFGW